MPYNKESGYGKFVPQSFEKGIAGKTFVVGKAGLAGLDMYREIFGGDPDGKLRFFSTIALALAQCTADQGDTIYVLPGHTESITGAAGLTLNKAGVNIIGLGSGTKRPTITFSTSTAAQIVISAANTTIKNVLFDLTGVSAVVAAFSVTAANVKFDTCDFIISTGTNAPVLGILTAATATGFTVDNCNFIGPATSTDTCTACIKHEVGTDYVIKNSYFTGKMTQAILNASAVLRGLIDSNRFVIATGTKAIAMHASSTPFIVNNRINVPSGTAPIVAAAGFVAGNVYSAAAGVTAGTASTI